MMDPERINTLQKKLMSDHYTRAIEAKRTGKLVVNVTDMFSVELIKAFEPGLATVHPEKYAVMLIVRGQAEKMADIAITRNYLDKPGCFYELINGWQ